MGLPTIGVSVTSIIIKYLTWWARSVILGCTEIGTLVKQTDIPVNLFDTTTIHAEKAAELALKD